MKTFSEILCEYVDKKDVNVQKLAEYCGLDRSTIYKFLRGSRVPNSADTVERIARYLMLDKGEKQALEEAYSISTVGAYRFYVRRKIREGLKNLSCVRLSAGYPLTETADTSVEEPSAFPTDASDAAIPVNNTYEMQRWLHRVLSYCFSRNNREVRIISPYDQNIILDMIFPYLDADHVVKHIFPMKSRTNDAGSDESKIGLNFDNFFAIIPFSMFNANYYPFYYYTKASSVDCLIHHPFMISCDRVTITFAGDFSRGIVYTSPELSRYYNHIFREQLSLCNKLYEPIQETSNLMDLIRDYSSMHQTGVLEAAYQLDPCLIPLIDRYYLDKYITNDFTGKEELIRLFLQYRGQMEEEQTADGSVQIYSISGFRDFLRSGRIREIPDFIYTPLEREDRCAMLEAAIGYAESREGFRLIVNSWEAGNTGLSLVVHDDILFLHYRKRDGVLCHYEITETSIVEGFRDFFQNCTDDFTYSKEESVQILRELLREYRGAAE